MFSNALSRFKRKAGMQGVQPLDWGLGLCPSISPFLGGGVRPLGWTVTNYECIVTVQAKSRDARGATP